MEILVHSPNFVFKKYVKLCLEYDGEHNVSFTQNKNTTVAIIDFINLKETQKLFYLIEDKTIKKIIFLESGSDLYLNTNCKLPFSVYEQFEPVKEHAYRTLEIESKLKDSNKRYVIFRVAELYGPNIRYGLIHDLFHGNYLKINDGYRDFIYEGDLISAIDIVINNDIIGKFNIGSGRRTKIDYLIDLVKNYRKSNIIIDVDKNIKIYIEYKCDNFKYYKWEALIQIETGLRTIKKFI